MRPAARRRGKRSGAMLTSRRDYLLRIIDEVGRLLAARLVPLPFAVVENDVKGAKSGAKRKTHKKRRASKLIRNGFSSGRSCQKRS